MAMRSKGAFQGNVQQIVVDGFGDEVGRFQLEPLNRHFQIRMSGNEDDFGFRREDLDVLQEIQPVHAGHPDVGDHDGDGPFREKLQGFLPRGHGDDVVPGVAERKTMTVRMPCSSSTRRMVSFMSPP